MADGLIWYSTPRYTVGLSVRAGRVVEAPPVARRWAMGRDARDLWRELARQRATQRGVRLEWLPDVLPVS
jgi:hypothetical protein